MQETQAQSLVWEDHLEKKIATHSTILAWENPWTEEPGGLQSKGHKKLDMTYDSNNSTPLVPAKSDTHNLRRENWSEHAWASASGSK